MDISCLHFITGILDCAYLLDGGWTENQLTQDIWNLKNANSKMTAHEIAQRIGECMVYVLNVRYPYLKNLDLIVPVPSGTPSREYNQAFLLAQYISNELDIQLQDILYVKEPYTPQKNTHWKSKRDNIRDKIGCRERIDDQRILLVDDTCITGSTMDECAGVLMDCGAVEVQGLAAAKAIDKTHKEFLAALRK